MSQVTSQLGDSLISGILSGQKFRQFQSDLKTSEIQRQLLEQQKNYNDTMQPLLLAHQQTQLDNERIRGQGSLLANKLAEATYGSAVEEAGARARGASADADTAVATRQPKVDSAKATARHQSALALRAELDNIANAGDGGVQLLPHDYDNLLTSWGIPEGEKGTRDVMSKMLQGAVGQAQQRLNDNRALVAQTLETKKVEAESAQALALQRELTQGKDISDLFSQVDPEEAAPLIAKMESGGRLSPADYAKIAVSSYRRRQGTAGDATVTTSPGEVEFQKKLGDELGTLYSQLNAAKRAKKELENGRELVGSEASIFSFDSTDRKRLVKQQEANIAELEDQIESTKSQLGTTTKTTVKSGGTTKSLTYPPEVVAYAKANNLKLKDNPTAAEIAEALSFVKSKK